MACEVLDEVRVASVGQQEGNVRDRFIGSIVLPAAAAPAGSQLSQQQIISEGGEVCCC